MGGAVTKRLPLLLVAACARAPARIAPDDAGARLQAEAATLAPPADAGDAAPPPLDAAADAPADACVPGETWDARIELARGWVPEVRAVTGRSLDLVVPRMGARKTIYGVCALTGGGCGDCAKPWDPAKVSCKLEPARAHVVIGTDDFATSVDVVQRGDAVVADWTSEAIGAGPRTTRTEVLLKLPCAVKVKLVR